MGLLLQRALLAGVALFLFVGKGDFVLLGLDAYEE